MPMASLLLLPLCLGLLLAPQAPGCLHCFSTPQQRLRVCQIFLGHTSPHHVTCLDTLRTTFQPYNQLVVGEWGPSSEAAGWPLLHLALCPPGASVSSPTWNHPPLFALPVEDVWKNEGDRTALTCRVQFQTPPEVRLSWKFAKDLKTRDLSFFRDLHLGIGSLLVLRPTRGSHRGTYACQLAQKGDILARKYFYLNVTGGSPKVQMELQDMFQAILQSPARQGTGGAGSRLPPLTELLAEPDSLQKRNVVLLMVGLALSSMLGTLVLG
uniref:Ig-like domain-containing protein n=1 Tax=Pelusios castaneus TaxID=367368 RepID=A0A8C8SDD2_9SAUR